jgi:hypothetical protein
MSGSPVMHVLGQGQSGNWDRSQDRGRAVGQGQQIAEPASGRQVFCGSKKPANLRRLAQCCPPSSKSDGELVPFEIGDCDFGNG